MKMPVVIICLCMIISVRGRVQAEYFTKKNAIRRFTIVVGANNGGPNRELLKYAVSDARSFHSVMRKMGGVFSADSILVLNPDKRNFYSAFRRIYHAVKQKRKQYRKTELIFYYSGHSDEEGILLGREKVYYTNIKEALKKISADVRIAILDSCSSGAFTRIKGGKKGLPFLIDSAYDMRGDAFMTSSSSDETSQESDRIRGSFFTYYLIIGLRGAADVSRDDRITLNEAYQYAYSETLNRTEKTMRGAQHPHYHIQMTGTGDVILTDIRKSTTRLVLAKEIDGKFFIRDDNNNLVVEFNKPYGASTQLAMAQGNYTVINENRESISQSRFRLNNRSSYILKQSDFLPVKREYTEVRGAKPNQNFPEKVVDPFKIGGYGSILIRFNRIAETRSSQYGIHAGAILNNRYIVGLGWFRLSAPREQKDIAHQEYSAEYPYVDFRYGGILFEYVYKRKGSFTTTTALLIGRGSIGFTENKAYDKYAEDVHGMKGFTVIEPEIKCIWNVSKYIGIGTSLSYRYVSRLDSEYFNHTDLRSLAVSIFIIGGTL
ncbi:MAG: caspase family protein [Spirochaetota bacterium]|nr:caspase family protein [Spirochaetota bacterium]